MPSVGRVPQSSGHVRQPDHGLVNSIAGHKAERRPGAGEERLAATQHDGVDVESILINKTKIGQASRQVWSGDVNIAVAASHAGTGAGSSFALANGLKRVAIRNAQRPSAQEPM